MATANKDVRATRQVNIRMPPQFEELTDELMVAMDLESRTRVVLVALKELGKKKLGKCVSVS